MEQLLKTVHGSHLYGLNHADSDYDEYIVVRSAPQAIFQRIDDDGLDQTVVTLNEFQSKIFQGSHQALEALFSPYAEIHPHFEHFFRGMRASIDETRMRYRRAAKHFAFDFAPGEEPIDPNPIFKKRRHGMRLAVNLNDLMRTRRFSPVLSTSQIAWINREAEVDASYADRARKNIDLACLGQLEL